VRPKLDSFDAVAILYDIQVSTPSPLGGNAFIEVAEGRPDLVDYCNWQDLAPDAASRQRAVIAETIKTKGQGRQWQCGMCKSVQAY
jgi:hypothetical protein